jgi:rhodanese-related sulfurtransferase
LTSNRVLAFAAGGLALLALFAGDGPASPPKNIDAVTVAEWIRDRHPGLRLIDLRAQQDFDNYHIPSARLITPGAIQELQLASGDTIVIYDDGSGDAARAAASLRARGLESVYVLPGGFYDWLDQVMNPQLPNDAASAAYQRQRELSLYFGGQPSAFSERTPKSTDQAIKRLRRRVC